MPETRVVIRALPGNAVDAKIRGIVFASAVKLAELSVNCNLQRQALLREQGYVIDEEKYPKVKALLKPSEAEEKWFEGTINQIVEF